jgi:hypothetical protein
MRPSGRRSRGWPIVESHAALIDQMRAEVSADVPTGGQPRMSERRIRTFADCLYESASTPGFVEISNRPAGSHLTPQSPPDNADAQAFAAFVATWVGEPLLAVLARAEAAEDH